MDITELLARLGYTVRPDGTEQQFKCDLHGGHDAKPSARVYPKSQSFYCFACGKSRDAVSLVMDTEGVDARDACTKLEAWYNLPPLPWNEEDRHDTRKEVEAALSPSETWERASTRCQALLQTLTEDRLLNPDATFRLWGLHDKIAWVASNGQMPQSKAKAAMDKISERVMAKLRDASRNP